VKQVVRLYLHGLSVIVVQVDEMWLEVIVASNRARNPGPEPRGRPPMAPLVAL
jgi:hypothetical protein